MMRNLIFIFLCFFSLQLLGQGANSKGINPRTVNPNGISVSLGGPGFYGSLSYDYFTSGKINIEAGVGLYALFGGIKYHLMGDQNNNWTPYIGINGVYVWVIDLIFEDDDDINPVFVYAPVGIHYISRGGFSFAVEGAAFMGAGEFVPFGALKFGYHF